VLCRQHQPVRGAVVAIDGSKFKAVNNRDKNFTVAKMARRMEQVEESITRYLRHWTARTGKSRSVARPRRCD
jgi:hypothetical protein